MTSCLNNMTSFVDNMTSFFNNMTTCFFRTNGYHMDSVKLISSELMDTIWIVLNLFLQN